jgi:hypothetical protein
MTSVVSELQELFLPLINITVYLGYVTTQNAIKETYAVYHEVCVNLYRFYCLSECEELGGVCNFCALK